LAHIARYKTFVALGAALR